MPNRSCVWHALLLGAVLLLPVLSACGAPSTAQSAASAGPSASRLTEPSAQVPVAPSTAPAASSAAPEQALRIHANAPFPDTLDPHLTSWVNEIGVEAMVYEGLTRLSSALEATPAAAESWTLSPGGEVITFTLRANLTYSDGSPLQAARFRDAIVRSCDPALAAPYSYVLFDVVGCEGYASTPVSDTAALDTARQALQDGVTAPDDRTLVIRLNHAAPYFPYIAGLWVLYPVKQELIDAGGATWWREAAGHVGNGPFTITELAPDERVAFAPNARYWDVPPKATAVEYLYILDSVVALQAYQAGDLDIMIPDSSQLPAIDADATLREELLTYPGANANILQFNMNREPFTDIHVRKAFAYALDRDTACTVIQNGACVPSLSWIPPGILGSIDTDAYAFDPEQARAELAASSYGSADKLPPIRLTYGSGDPAQQPRIEWLAQQFREHLGVTIELEPLEGSAYVDLLTDNATFPQMTFNGWIQDYPDAQNWLGILWDSRAEWAQRAGFQDETFDRLVRAADREPDAVKRTELYEEASRRLVELQPGVFMSNSAVTFLVKPHVSGYTTTVSDTNWPGEWGSRQTIAVTP